MAKAKLGFEDFIAAVGNDCQAFVMDIHNMLSENGCKIEVKDAKSGYVVSYVLDKKTIVNYVFRKKGLIVRIYANHISNYMEVLDTFPAEMAKGIQAAPVCKRLVNPDACNPKCAMGYDFLLKGERLQRCRYNAFMFFVCEENNPYIKMLLEKELLSCGINL